MKRILALLMIAALTLCMAACGAKTPANTESQTEASTDPAATEPEIGRIGEKGTFYVYIPDEWCKMEYSNDNTRIRLFATRSAPKIEEGKTAEVEIKVAAENGKKEDVDAAVAELLKIEGAKKGKDFAFDGEKFTVVTYTDAKEERVYTVYTGLGCGRLASITLKGIEPTNEDAAAILKSVSFKSVPTPNTTTTTVKATTAPAKETAGTEKATEKK